MTDDINVYLSDNIDKPSDLLLRLALSRSMPADYYTIVISDKEDELLAIYGSFEVNSNHFSLNNSDIIGFAKGKSKAKKLVTSIIDDMLLKNLDITKDNFRILLDQ